MGGAFLRAMAMKISQSEAFFDALSSRQVKMRLYRVKMMSYEEKTKKHIFLKGFFLITHHFDPMEACFELTAGLSIKECFGLTYLCVHSS